MVALKTNIHQQNLALNSIIENDQRLNYMTHVELPSQSCETEQPSLISNEYPLDLSIVKKVNVPSSLQGKLENSTILVLVPYHECISINE